MRQGWATWLARRRTWDAINGAVQSHFEQFFGVCAAASELQNQP